ANNRARLRVIPGIPNGDAIRVTGDEIARAGAGLRSQAADRVPAGDVANSVIVTQRDRTRLVRPDQVPFDEVARRIRIEEPDAVRVVARNEVTRAGRRAPDRFVCGIVQCDTVARGNADGIADGDGTGGIGADVVPFDEVVRAALVENAAP